MITIERDRLILLCLLVATAMLVIMLLPGREEAFPTAPAPTAPAELATQGGFTDRVQIPQPRLILPEGASVRQTQTNADGTSYVVVEVPANTIVD